MNQLDTNLRDFMVLAIEDDPDAMKCIAKSMPTGGKIIPPPGESNDYNDYSNLCKHGLDGEAIVDGKTVTLKNELKKLIENNYSNLRAIVCDVKLGESEQGGVDVIKWIRDQRNGVGLIGDYLRYIPIVVFSSLSNATPERQDAAVAAGATGYAPKNDATITKKDKDEKLKSLLSSQVEYFDYIFTQLYKKEYAVALSFTGNKGTELHREFVEEVALHLDTCYTRQRVFLDRDKQDDGTTVSYSKKDFMQIYKEKSEYVVVFISSDYNTEKSPWTQNESEGIKEYYEVSPKHVIFVVLEKEFTEIEFKEKMGIEPVIWVNANDSLKSFYEVRDCMDAKLMQKAELLCRQRSTIMEYTKECIDIYKEKSAEIAKGIVQTIRNSIDKVEKGLK